MVVPTLYNDSTLRDPKLRANATRLLQHPFLVNTPPATFVGMRPDTLKVRGCGRFIDVRFLS